MTREIPLRSSSQRWMNLGMMRNGKFYSLKPRIEVEIEELEDDGRVKAKS